MPLPDDSLPLPDSHRGPARAVALPAQSDALDVSAPPSPNEAADYLMLDQARWDLLHRQCEILVGGGALHRTLDTPAKAMVVAMKAVEMRIPLTAAWSGMRIIDGEVTLVGKLALRMIQERALPHGAVCKRIPVDPQEEGRCSGWLMGRPGSEPSEYWFTMEMAKSAGLLRMRGQSGEWFDTPAYKNYPDRMLSWRALAKGAAYEFQDILQGCMLTEEMGHKDATFIDAQSRIADGARKTRPGSREEVSRGREEITNKHPLMQQVSTQLHSWVEAVMSAVPEPDDIPDEAWYGRLRSDKWRDISTLFIKGMAPTDTEAREMLNALAAETREVEARRLETPGVEHPPSPDPKDGAGGPDYTDAFSTNPFVEADAQAQEGAVEDTAPDAVEPVEPPPELVVTVGGEVDLSPPRGLRSAQVVGVPSPARDSGQVERRRACPGDAVAAPGR